MHAVAATCRPDERIRSLVKPEKALSCPLTLLRVRISPSSLRFVWPSPTMCVRIGTCLRSRCFERGHFQIWPPGLASMARITGQRHVDTPCALPLEGRVCTVDCEPAEAIPEEDIVEDDQAVAAKRHAHQDGDEQVGLWFRRWIVPHRLWRRQLALWRRRHGRRPAPRAAHDRPSDCAKQRRAGRVRADAGSGEVSGRWLMHGHGSACRWVAPSLLLGSLSS